MKTESLEVQAAEKTAKEIGELVVAFQKKCATVADEQIEITNDARRIGLMVQEWTGTDQITFGFFQAHKAALPKKVTFEMLKTFSSIATRLTDAVSTLDDVRRVWQPTFQTAGLLQIPERQPQSVSQTTPFIDLVNRIGAVRLALAQWTRDEPLEDWEQDRRANVKEQMKPLVEFYETL